MSGAGKKSTAKNQTTSGSEKLLERLGNSDNQFAAILKSHLEGRGNCCATDALVYSRTALGKLQARYG